jgi:hypothetical protein
MSGNTGHATLRHISIRVPWHDTGWEGKVCDAPKLNGACLKLKNIALSKDENAEAAIAGQSIQDLDQQDWPPCISERVTFMAPFDFYKRATHPYFATSQETHGHFLPTPLRHPAYSAPAIPFRWMRSDEAERHYQEHRMVFEPEREPKLSFESGWLQDHENQKSALDCFYQQLEPGTSLCFFYAKQVPFVEDVGRVRVLIGVGRYKRVGPATEYKYSETGDDKLCSILWERMVHHSIRPDFQDGFLLPYHAAVERAEEDPNFDPAEIAAFAPSDRIDEFSFATEHVTHDGAIAALLSLAVSLQKSIEYHLPGPWDRCLKWIDARLAELWKMRGPCPGLGAALCAYGIELGTFVAREIAAQVGDNEDPWPLVDNMFQQPEAYLSRTLAKEISPILQKAWKRMPEERKALLKLLSRFEITPDQAKVLFVREERKKKGIACSDDELLSNPYLIFEKTINSVFPVSVWTVDRGVFPDPAIREKHPLPEPSAIKAGTDERRIRAFCIEILERAADEGNTLLSQSDIILQVRNLPIQPACEVTSDSMDVAEDVFAGVIDVTSFKDDSKAYQLHRLTKMGDVIRRVVLRRLRGNRHNMAVDWRQRLDEFLAAPVTDELEDQARTEKAAALKELAESRFSVLIGQAGTGKTTLLSVLCNHPDVEAGGVLLLAPTGKASVKMAQSTKLRAYTIAQFLNGCGRYDPQTFRYQLSPDPPLDTADTVIVDEASMLTEEMLAALFDALKGVKRLILVGDPRQLPPIGPGRPFVDIVSKLEVDDVETRFPCVSPGYAELTILRRQTGESRADLQLANWFRGRSLAPGEDAIFETLAEPEATKFIRFESWETAEEFGDKLLQILAEELKLEGPADSFNFDIRLGGNPSGEFVYFNRGIAEAVENWQILTPVRAQVHGVTDINRLIHKAFKAKTIEFARKKRRRTPKPMGEEEIVYGDKVINLYNHRHYRVYPRDDARKYIANGEIGIVNGQFKTKRSNFSGLPWELEVEFSSQPDFQYKYDGRYFNEETEPALELAYALTVHKAQGSEFKLVILVLPNPCRLLSRELLYTALTRQRDRVVILHQGDRSELRKYSSDLFSDTACRLTNLFRAPNLVEVQVPVSPAAGGAPRLEKRFLEENLIHRTVRGDAVRSKSEVIIADQLAAQEIVYSYEKALQLNGSTRYPDFTIEDEESGLTFYWEHCGMLHKPEYRERWEAKKRLYRANGILPYEEGGGENGTLIETRDDVNGGISSQEIATLIKQVILEEI